MSTVLCGWLCVALGVVVGLFLACLFRADRESEEVTK